MCDCAQLEDIVDCGESELDEFVLPRQLVFLRAGDVCRLYVCPECGIHWHVDDGLRAPQAIKVTDPSSWESFDDKPFRLRYWERYHGGSGTAKCMWRGCESRVLKGLAFCGRHAYPEFV
jgi:hypothetical protein